MSYEQSLINIKNSMNFLMPIYEDHAVFCSFENNLPSFKFVTSLDSDRLISYFKNKKVGYAMIILSTDGCFQYCYKDSTHYYTHNYDTKESLSDYYIGHRQDIASDFIELMRLLKKSR